jgi:lactoylglutathione lyase
MESSLRFYHDIVGLEILRRFPIGEGKEIVFLGSGDTEVELISGEAVTEPGKGISMGFVSESLENTIELLIDKGYQTDGNIISPNPHVRFIFARDPDGYSIQFVQSGK